MPPKDLVAASSTPIVLAILARGESYGYEIIQEVRAVSRGELEWTDGMLYPVLHRLERKGLIRSRWVAPEGGRRRSTTGSRAGERPSSPPRSDAGPPCMAPSPACGGKPVFDLQSALTAWRREMASHEAVGVEALAELESHLLDAFDALCAQGHDAEEAFDLAVRRLGRAARCTPSSPSATRAGSRGSARSGPFSGS